VRHVLVDDDGAVTGIIDWGDVCVADPGIDLSIAYSAFRGPARAALLGAYGSVSDDQRLRARVLALFLSSTLAIYAHHSAMLALEAEALSGLERAIEP
jgi:aminoglycoside phosphotransferase (APT) family kinase protein